jgi:GTP-binding protein
MFIDEVKIFVRSGRGGDGMLHFHREKYVPRGGPDGGDGGYGGDVILEVRPTLNTLASFHHATKYVAGDGGKGGVNDMTGRSAEHLIIPVAPGTVVRDDKTGELLGDLVEPFQRLTVCKGGRPGRGNPHFANARVQAPRTAEKGEPGEDRVLRLELRLIADVGIVGVPNAGKSSLLASVTNAKPKIADYPFTTVEPNLGVAELDLDHSLVLADIPGLIEGAHMGVGLGFAFLRHVQRTRVLIHMLDGMAEDPIADFAQINSEMALFDPNLAKKPQLVVVNKIDLPDVAARWPELKRILEQKGYEPMAISAAAHTNVRELLWKTAELLKASPPHVEVPADTLPVYRAAEDPHAFTIAKTADGYQVHGASIERSAEMTFWEYDGSVRRFQRLLETLGVEKALREAGVQEGDTVFIGDFELEWQD